MLPLKNLKKNSCVLFGLARTKSQKMKSIIFQDASYDELIEVTRQLQVEKNKLDEAEKNVDTDTELKRRASPSSGY